MMVVNPRSTAQRKAPAIIATIKTRAVRYVTSLLESQTTFFSSAQIPAKNLNLLVAVLIAVELLVIGKTPPLETQDYLTSL
jgi:hypothetical protein